MAHRRSSLKKIRSDRRRRIINVRVISDLRSKARELRMLIANKKTNEALNGLKELCSKLDKAVKKGVIHKNQASRQKSRFALATNHIKKSK